MKLFIFSPIDLVQKKKKFFELDDLYHKKKLIYLYNIFSFFKNLSILSKISLNLNHFEYWILFKVFT